ncbi:MAG: hypothetical protein ACRDOK_14790 [Streptosporangiaceae bacterium]
MTSDQLASVCPQCGKSDAVHTVQELAGLAKTQLGQQPPGSTPQEGWNAEPQQGPAGGWGGEPRSGPPPGPGGLPGGGLGGLHDRDSYADNPLDAIGADIAGIAMGAAARFVGRAIGRRVQRTMSERVLPTLAANRETALRAQIEIAERHPDLCACLTDQVVFLTGGSRVAPMPNLGTLTLEQADALVATLRGSPAIAPSRNEVSP